MMLFSSHVAAGFLVGRRAPSPVGFSAGLVSHLLMDALPHWGTSDRERFLKVARVDGLFGGSLAALLLFHRPSAVWAVAGAALPDLEKPFRHFTSRNLFPARLSRSLAVLQDESESRWPAELSAAAVLVAAALLSSVGRSR